MSVPRVGLFGLLEATEEPRSSGGRAVVLLHQPPLCTGYPWEGLGAIPCNDFHVWHPNCAGTAFSWNGGFSYLVLALKYGFHFGN